MDITWISTIIEQPFRINEEVNIAQLPDAQVIGKGTTSVVP
jgi:hypothetical protein